MKVYLGIVVKIQVIFMITIGGNFPLETLAQNANISMFSTDLPGEFLDLKKFGIKDHFEKPNSYDSKEFQPHSTKDNSATVQYEFVIFKSESESSTKIETIKGGLIFLDRQQFKSIGLTLLKGDPFAVFNNEFNILISDRIAQAYFGNEDPIDKILILENKYAVLIKGVYGSKQHSLPFEFDFIGGPITNEKINKVR